MKEKLITAGGLLQKPGQTAQNTIILRQPKRFNLDIADYTSAFRYAENVDIPRRYQLYNLYDDILLDSHLHSVIDRRLANVSAANISFTRKGNPDDTINEQIASPWFQRLIRDILDARFWGFSLMQFYKEPSGWIDYMLVPRNHVDPTRRIILRQETDFNGTPFEEFSHLLLVGHEYDLGILRKAAPWVIYKRNDIADWAQFTEIFGMPTREYVYDTDDDDARQRAIEDAQEEGALSTFIHSKDTEMKLVESGTKTASADLYEKLCQRCNNELSKLILGNTLTTESQVNGTQSLGTVHKKEEDTLLRDDQKYVLNVLNYDMTDIFLAMGINTKGGRFDFVDPKYTDLQSKVNIMTQLHNTFDLPIDDDYLYSEFGIEKPHDYDKQKRQHQDKQQPSPSRPSEPASDPSQQSDSSLPSDPSSHSIQPKKETPKSFLRRFRDFFVQAPHDGAHLDW